MDKAKNNTGYIPLWTNLTQKKIDYTKAEEYTEKLTKLVKLVCDIEKRSKSPP